MAPLGRGVKTCFSDDLLWLVYATSRYVTATSDMSILDEDVPFLSARPLADNEEDRYELFEAGTETGTLFEHCRCALNHGVLQVFMATANGFWGLERWHGSRGP